MTTQQSTSTNLPSQTIQAAIASFPINHDEYNWRPGQETAENCKMVLGTPKQTISAKHFAKVYRR